MEFLEKSTSIINKLFHCFVLIFFNLEMCFNSYDDIVLLKAQSRKYRGIFEEHSPVK